jgi:hypothetical protein
MGKRGGADVRKGTPIRGDDYIRVFTGEIPRQIHPLSIEDFAETDQTVEGRERPG